MINLAVRNLRIFFRQKSSVFFSLLGVFIIIGLYVMFLGDVWVRSIPEGVPGARNLMNNWMIAGIVSVASITTAMGAFGIMVEDRARKNSKDFHASPVKRSSIVGGYILSAFTVGLIMSLVTFAIGQIYIVASGGALLPFGTMLKFLGVLFISVLASSALVFFIISFISSLSAFSTASTVLGTLIGFLTGVYLPVGNMPEAMQWVITLFPVSHASALMRQLMLEAPMDESFAGVPEAIVSDFEFLMGITFTYGDYTASPWVHVAVLVGVAVVFFFLALWNVSRKSK